VRGSGCAEYRSNPRMSQERREGGQSPLNPERWAAKDYCPCRKERDVDLEFWNVTAFTGWSPGMEANFRIKMGLNITRR
jgi:hypothetical protein